MHSNKLKKKKRSLGFAEIETKFCGNSLAYSEFPVYQNRPGAILTELQVLPPPSTKATDICKSCRVQLHAPECSSTHSSLAGNFYAGPPQKTPDYSLASAHLLSKGIKKKSSLIHTLFSMYHTESVRIIRSNLRKAHTHLIFPLFEVS